MYAIEAVRHFELGNPLIVVISALDSNFSYFGDFTKFDLNPLVWIICSRRPGTGLTATTGFVESGVGRSMVNGPLQSIIQINQSIIRSVEWSVSQPASQLLAVRSVVNRSLSK